MTKKVISKYLAIIALFTVSSCTYNQYTTVQGGNDDLYGGGREAVAVTSNRQSTNYDPYRNPDYAEVPDKELEGTDQYYDENYVTARNIQRRVGSEVGYNDGFVDGYYAGRNTGFNSGFYNSMYPMFGYGSRFSMGFRIGMGGMLGMSYSPFGMGYSPFGWNRWGYDPFFHNSMAWGNPFYGGMGYYGGLGMMGMYNGFYGMPNWGSYYPVIVNNYGDSGVRTRNYGIRESSSAINRNSIAAGSSRNSVGNAVNSRNTNGTRNSVYNNNARDGYYARPRGGDVRTSTGIRSNTADRTSTSTNGADYYSSPRASRSYGSTEGAVRSTNNSNRSSSSSNYNAPSRTYSAPSRSSAPSYNAPSRSSAPSYNAPSRSSVPSYSAPSRSSAPSYSAPSRSSAPSYSAPSRSSSGGTSRSR